jgi:hypothetical protein
MTPISFPGLLLRLRLALSNAGPLRCGAALLCVIGAGALVWLAPQRERMAHQHARALAQAKVVPNVVVSAPVVANQNLVLFYSSLGEQRYVEQQVKTLFALAAKTGLSLSQGEYKSGRDKNARLHTYQITLPVKGSYKAIWEFGLLALRAMPFASLDEISFKRETVTDNNVEARLRLTLYLAERADGGVR